MNKFFIFIGLALLLFGGAEAATITGDFSLETDCTVPAEATYVLHNDSGTTQAYSIKAAGENRDWINVNGVWIGETALKITIKGNESAELYAFVKPQSCYVPPGNYTVAIEISNGGTTTREIKVIVAESRVLELSISPEKRTIAQCGTAEFSVKAKNTGEMDEIVALSVEGIPQQWAKLAFAELFLAKGEAKTVQLEIRPACDAMAKEHVFSIKAALKGTSFSTSKSASVEIEDRQGIQISGAQLEACMEKETQGNAAIKNTGLLEDKVSLGIEGVSWARVEPAQLALAAGEEKPVSIIFAKSGAAKGAHEFTLKASSAKFSKDYEKKLSVNLKECYAVSIEDETIDSSLIAKNTTACIENNPVYAFSLRNDAIEAITAQILALGIDTVVSPARLEIGSGETKEARVEIGLSGEQPGKKVFTITAKGENFSISKEVEFEAEDCYALEVDWNGLEKKIELDANYKSEPFTVRVLNNGTRAQSASVSVQGVEWIYFEPEQAAIQPGKEQKIYLYFAPPYDTKEGAHKATISVKGKQDLLEKDVNMTVYGGLYAALGTASIKADTDAPQLTEKTERTLKVSVALSNDGNSMVRVLGISSKDFNAAFEFREKALQPGESIEVPMEFYVGESTERKFTMALLISTDKGTIEREITVDLDKKEGQNQLIGLFNIGNASDLLLAIIVIAVIAVFAVIALKSDAAGQRSETGLAHLAKDVQAIPGKKLEQIGKHKKASGTHSGLQEIVDEVRKKHAAKKGRAKKKK